MQCAIRREVSSNVLFAEAFCMKENWRCQMTCGADCAFSLVSRIDEP